MVLGLEQAVEVPECRFQDGPPGLGEAQIKEDASYLLDGPLQGVELTSEAIRVLCLNVIGPVVQIPPATTFKLFMGDLGGFLPDFNPVFQDLLTQGSDLQGVAGLFMDL